MRRSADGTSKRQGLPRLPLLLSLHSLWSRSASLPLPFGGFPWAAAPVAAAAAAPNLPASKALEFFLPEQACTYQPSWVAPSSPTTEALLRVASAACLPSLVWEGGSQSSKFTAGPSAGCAVVAFCRRATARSAHLPSSAIPISRVRVQLYQLWGPQAHLLLIRLGVTQCWPATSSPCLLPLDCTCQMDWSDSMG